MTHPTNPHPLRPHAHRASSRLGATSTHRRIREAMGPGYQVAIFHETSSLTAPRPARR